MKNALPFAWAAACVLFCGGVMASACAQQNSCTGNTVVDVQFEARTFPAQKIGNAVLFKSGMYVDADGAPNAYGPNNRGLDFTANALRDGRFLSVATHPDGKPVIQRSGRFKGFYVSTTSLHNVAGSPTAPGTYVDARKIPYIVLPPEFMKQFGVALGDLAMVTNLKNGKTSFAIFADIGPRGKIGEGSVALAHGWASMTIHATAVRIPILPILYSHNPALARTNSGRRKRSKIRHQERSGDGAAPGGSECVSLPASHRAIITAICCSRISGCSSRMRLDRAAIVCSYDSPGAPSVTKRGKPG